MQNFDKSELFPSCYKYDFLFAFFLVVPHPILVSNLIHSSHGTCNGTLDCSCDPGYAGVACEKGFLLVFFTQMLILSDSVVDGCLTILNKCPPNTVCAYNGSIQCIPFHTECADRTDNCR